jgi:hypothetical protein
MDYKEVTMGYENLLDKFGLRGEILPKKRPSTKWLAHLSEPAYLRQSSDLIKSSLQSGLDVLQLANGDIVTTETKTVVTKYVWNVTKKKLVQKNISDEPGSKARRPKPAARKARQSEDA